MGNTLVEKVSTALLSMQRYSWEQGVTMQAFLEMGQLDTVCAMAFESINRSIEDGRAAVIGVTDGVTDHCSIGEGLKKACELTGNEFLGKGRQELRKWALERAPRNEAGIVYHLTRTKEFWADSFYMFPPYLAVEGEYEEAMKQWNGYWAVLYDPEAGLLCHQWNDATKSYTRKAHWGVGNGWALAAIPRMLEHLPKETFAQDRQELISKGTRLLESLLKYMRPDGFFHDVVDDPATFVETNLSQMAAYFIYRGVSEGWLDEKYLATADKLRQAAESKVNEFGFVADVCGAPTFDKAGFAPEGQAFFLLMENAAQKVKKA